jgi:hypothetical protein
MITEDELVELEHIIASEDLQVWSIGKLTEVLTNLINTIRELKKPTGYRDVIDNHIYDDPQEVENVYSSGSIVRLRPIPAAEGDIFVLVGIENEKSQIFATKEEAETGKAAKPLEPRIVKRCRSFLGWLLQTVILKKINK